MDGQTPATPPTQPALGGGAGKLIGGIIILIVILLLGYYFLRSNTTEDTNTRTESSQQSGDAMMEKEGEGAMTKDKKDEGAMMEGDVKAFTVSGQNFNFSPSEIRVKQGDKVKITFDNIGGFHDFRVEGYNIGTKQFQSPGQEVLEFIADKAGTFVFFCSVGTHRQQGMVGSLVVE